MPGGAARALRHKGRVSRITDLGERLVVNPLARGTVYPDPLFLGLATAPNGAVIDFLGRPSPCMFTLGSPRKGILLETTAVPELRLETRTLAEELTGAADAERRRVPDFSSRPAGPGHNEIC